MEGCSSARCVSRILYKVCAVSAYCFHGASAGVYKFCVLVQNNAYLTITQLLLNVRSSAWVIHGWSSVRRVRR